MHDNNHLLLENVYFKDNVAKDIILSDKNQNGGGAIYCNGKLQTFNSTSCRFLNNTSLSNGGAALIDISNLTSVKLSVNIKNVVIQGNNA